MPLPRPALDQLPGAWGARVKRPVRNPECRRRGRRGPWPGAPWCSGAAASWNGTVRARRPGVREPAGPASSGGGGEGSAAVTYETCWGYYDVSGRYDKEFECNNSESGYLYCQLRHLLLPLLLQEAPREADQRQCTNYQSPVWVQTPSTKVVSPGQRTKADPEKDKTSLTVYITRQRWGDRLRHRGRRLRQVSCMTRPTARRGR